MVVGLRTVLLIPDGIRLRISPVVLHDRPRTRQRVIDYGDLVMGDVGIGFVDENVFLDNTLIVEMQWHSARVVSAGASETACLHFENIVAAIPVSIDPLTYRVAK